MIEIRQTDVFSKWLRGLRDIQARARVQTRIDRLETGNPGDAKPVGNGVSGMRVHYGPGYRVNFIQRGNQLIVLLAGGDKDSQTTDIKRAIALSKELDDGENN